MRKWRLLMALLLVLHAPAPGCAQDRGTAGPEEIYFATFRPANWDVYLFEVPGTPPRALTSDPGLDYGPALSPDGRWVVFTSERGGDPDLFGLDLEGGGSPRLLIESSAMEDQAAFSPDGQTLAFVSSHAGNADVYSIPFLPDRVQPISEAVNLSRHPAGDFRPAISPDGTLIAFSSDRDHSSDNANPIARTRGGDLYVMSLDGGRARRVTTTTDWAGSPAWSPNGRELYHYRRSFEGRIPRYGLWAVHADGTGQRLIYEDSLAVLSPVPFPDEDRIAFARGPAARGTRGGITSWGIWSVPADGGEAVPVSGGPRGLLGPAFGGVPGMLVTFGGGPVPSDRPQSGAARALGEGPLLTANAPWFRQFADRTVSMFPVRELFVAAHPTADAVIRTVPPGPILTVSHPDGTDARPVMDLGGGFPANGVTASPDGEWFVYMQGRMFGDPATEADLWKVRPDGSGAVNLTPDSPGNDGFASFGPDGRWLAFRSGRDGNFEIYRMDADGGLPVNLTQHPARDVFPAVSPRGDRIAFLSDRDSDVPRLYDLYVMDLDARGEAGTTRRVTDNEVQEGHPYFSPDGQWLVFTSEMGGLNDEEPVVQSFLFAPQMYGELYAVRVADGLLIRLTHDKWEDGFPTWVPAASERSREAGPAPF